MDTREVRILAEAVVVTHAAEPHQQMSDKKGVLVQPQASRAAEG